MSTGLLLARLRELASASELPLLYVTDYFGRIVRETLAAAGISRADETDWAVVNSVAPLIL